MLLTSTMHPFFLSCSYLLILLSCNVKSTTDSLKYSEDIIDTPRPFAAGIISSEANSEFGITFTPDGRTAYFSRRAPGEKQKIYKTEFSEGQWSQPMITSFSTDRDETPSITPNGELFFFGSERPIPNRPNKGNFDMNIWMMEKQGNEWGRPTVLPFPINDVQIEGEEWPSSNNNFLFSNDNITYYYTAQVRGAPAIQLYQTSYVDEKWTEPIRIDGLFDNPEQWIYSAVISPDDRYLLFNSYGGADGMGGEDIYVSKRTRAGWTKAKPIGPLINSKNEESSPMFSRDGKYFFYNTSENLGNYEYGEWDINYIETSYLDLASLFE